MTPEQRAFRIVIQSRLSSTRLPAKALLPLGGMPIAVLCARRAASTGAEVIVATSTDASDDVLASTLESADISVLRGDLDDVLARFVAATQDLPDEAVVIRLTADNVFPDGEFVDQLLASLSDGADYVAAEWPAAGAPYGMSAEAFTVNILRRADQAADSSADREHVTPWIKRNGVSARFAPHGLDTDMSGLRCTLDTLMITSRLERVFRDIEDPESVSWMKLCRDRRASEPGSAGAVPWRPRGGVLHAAITLGTAQLGLDYGYTNTSGAMDDADARSLIRHALGAGVRCIDTARAYGTAETRVGAALVGGLAGQVEVVTKLAPDFESYVGSSDDVLSAAVDASIFRSCTELRASRLGTVLLHRWSHRTAFDGAIWRRLLELRGDGVIGELGVSVQDPHEALEALRDADIKHIQLPFNIIDNRWLDADIDVALRDRVDVTVHGRSAFLQGVLLTTPDHWPALDGVDSAGISGNLDALVDEFGRAGRADLCLAYVLGQSWVDSVVLGVDNVGQFDEVLGLLSRPALTRNQCVRAREVLGAAPVQLVDPSNWS